MTKEEILQNIKISLNEEKSNNRRNSMCAYESLYNPYYMVGTCFTNFKKITVDESELPNFSESELNNLIKLADYAGDSFY